MANRDFLIAECFHIMLILRSRVSFALMYAALIIRIIAVDPVRGANAETQTIRSVCKSMGADHGSHGLVVVGVGGAISCAIGALIAHPPVSIII
jgi:hypothetical protein